MLRCGQNEIKIRSAHGSYMKNSAEPMSISIFVVAEPDQNTVRPWRLLRICNSLNKLPNYTMLFFDFINNAIVMSHSSY